MEDIKHFEYSIRFDMYSFITHRTTPDELVTMTKCIRVCRGTPVS